MGRVGGVILKLIPDPGLLVPSTLWLRRSGEALPADRRTIGPGNVPFGSLVTPVFVPPGGIPLQGASSPSAHLEVADEPARPPVGVNWWRADSQYSGIRTTLPTARASSIATSPPILSLLVARGRPGRGQKINHRPGSLLAQTAHGAPSWPGACCEPRVPARPDHAIRRDHGVPGRTFSGATSMT
jgi:hypothetical protein